ncbi:MAG TPA: hypothetical protein VHV51_13530 [Polyangiaceae bacterium]|jgi:hypothetical protein|nr:hypothetical protein [Polyangiaceae bacterium]
MRALSFGFSCFSLLAASFGVSACGSSHDEVSKRLAAMQADLTSLQKHDDRLEERLEALELRHEAVAARPADSAPIADHPKLLVVKLEPGDDAHDAPSDTPAEIKPEDSVSDKSPRPVIRVHGANSDGDVRMASDSDVPPDTSSKRKRGQ